MIYSVNGSRCSGWKRLLPEVYHNAHYSGEKSLTGIAVAKSRQNILILIIFLLLSLSSQSLAQKADPYHRSSGGFGYLIASRQDYSLWWAEGAYKIMYDTPVPRNHAKSVDLWAAGNEYEPFQLVIKPNVRTDNLMIGISDLISINDTIPNTNAELRSVGYVQVTKPTDDYGFAGMWPDPLPPVSGTATLCPDENFVYWITVYVPHGAKAGAYNGHVTLSCDRWEKKIPVKLNVWGFVLPDVPSIRSGFGISIDKIIAYHNLTDRSDIEKTYDLYMQAFRDYRIAPYYFSALYPVKEIISGVMWKGGYFDPDDPYEGDYSLRVEDDSRISSIDATYQKEIVIEPGIDYRLSWVVRSGENDQQYCVLAESINADSDLMMFENRMDVFKADTIWKSQSFKLGAFSREVSRIRLTLFPAFRTEEGEYTGTVWFDNIMLTSNGSGNNLLVQGDFEVDINDIDIQLDFSDFDFAASRYLDGFGFNSFRLDLKGMGGGTYFSRREGQFEGFPQGTQAYEKLMDRYLGQIQDHLKENGWLGKEYVYWFDEPGTADYPFVREGMETIRRGAPEITTFLTENDPGPEIMDVTDITCTIWHRIDPAKAQEIVGRGQGYWSYLCTAPKSPWVSEFIDHDAINLRIWLWMSYSYRLDGILIWSTNYWTSRAGSPSWYLQDPWKEAASYVQDYGWPLGKQTNWGNGDGRLWYPPNREPNMITEKYIEGPVPSLRIEFLRQGIEDFEYLKLLEKLLDEKTDADPDLLVKGKILLDIPSRIFSDGKTYTKDPQDLLSYRKKLAEIIIKLQRSNIQ
ncbi:MAG TPA: glycoside hydrolase domain-containing protein [Bacteroidales bacterium]|nr:glycoside hydrolase domain-containing protein [Bacteroidales bacterium]